MARMTSKLVVLFCASLFATNVAGCDEGPSSRDAEDSGDDGDTTPDVPDSDDTPDADDTDAVDDTGDTADTGDADDTRDTDDTVDPDADDTVDPRDTDDTQDTADTGDTGDTSDTHDGEVVTACEQIPGDPAFDDHTVSGFASSACFFEYAGEPENDHVVVKFVVVDVNHGTPVEADLRFYENGFYQLHDEWYWFRLLNGQAIPNLADPAPVQGLSFPTIASIYQAYAGQTTLPLDLRRQAGGGTYGGRLYSARFYDLALGTDADYSLAARFFVVGSLVHYAPNAARPYPDEIWALELEFTDRPTIAYLERTIAVLEAKLPPELAGRLLWIARSPTQDALVSTIRQSTHWLKDRVLTYDDLVVPGAVEVYNEGIAAGLVHVLDADFSPNDLQANEIAILPRVPDDIPPSRVIISAVPQTQLAHVNLLAKSRGTPNVYMGGILSNGDLQRWEWARTRIIVEATASGVTFTPMKPEDYEVYEGKLVPPIRNVEQVPNLPSAPLTVSLTEGGLATMHELVPLAGGKAAGFLSFLEVPEMATPDAPLAITIRPFVEHQAEFVPLFRAAFVEADFVSDSRVRFMVLEGEEAYLEENGDDPIGLGLLESVKAAHADDELGYVLASGGARRMLLDKPMATETLRALRADLVARFGFLAKTQALRFRSSSTAEDVPGFNGAGLYVSNTGFLYPAELSDPSDRARTVEHAIKETWASYWGFQAFEERRAGRIDPFQGNMALAVHARFDDAKERANAVATFWYTAYGAEPSRRLVLNVQKGALAVTNPGGTLELPEIDEVVQLGDDGPLEVRRVQRSTVAEPDELLLSDDELRTLFAHAAEHTGKWLAEQGADIAPSERPRTLVLDYELKYVKAGWPALASGEVRPERIVWRQARVLDQITKVAGTLIDPWSGPTSPVATYLPVDLRTAVRELTAVRCDSAMADLRVYYAYTESSLRELFPFDTTPFVYKVVVDFKQAPPGLSPSLNNWLIQWTHFAEREVDAADGARVVFNSGIATTLGIDGLELGADGTYRVWQGASEFSGTCTRVKERPYQSPSSYLRGILHQ